MNPFFSQTPLQSNSSLNVYDSLMQHALDISMMLNDHMAACVATNPNRFVGEESLRCWSVPHFPIYILGCVLGLGTLPMQSPELACQELRRCVTELGLAGVQVGPRSSVCQTTHHATLLHYTTKGVRLT